MPEFSVESWESFKRQFLSVFQFIYYCFDMLFDACRSHPMLYVFFFFPVFIVSFFIIFEMFVHIAPFVGVINNKQVKGVLSGSKLSAKSYGKSLNSSHSVQNLASKKAAQDAKAHAAMINKINGSSSSGTSLSSKSMSSGSYSSINSSAEGKAVHGSNRIKNINDFIKIKKEDKIKAQEKVNKAQEKEDKAFNMRTDVLHSREGNNLKITTVKTNTRTGEVVSTSDRIIHKDNSVVE